MYASEIMITTNDAELDNIVEKFVQKQMLRSLEMIIMEENIITKWKKGENLNSHEIFVLISQGIDFVPDYFNTKDIPETLKELYLMIDSDEYYIPNLVQEYILGHALDYMAEMVKDFGNKDDDTFRMPRRIDIIKAAADVDEEYEEYDDEYTREDSLQVAEDRVISYENFWGIIEECFFDMDYTMLDDMTPEQIVESGIDEAYGVGALEPARKILLDGSMEHVGKNSSIYIAAQASA